MGEHGREYTILQEHDRLGEARVSYETEAAGTVAEHALHLRALHLHVPTMTSANVFAMNRLTAQRVARCWILSVTASVHTTLLRKLARIASSIV